MHARSAGLAALLVLVTAAPALAQGSARRGARAPKDTVKVVIPADIELRFDREVFIYPAQNRRDPFQPLAGEGVESETRFENLVLQGVVFSSTPGRSVATLMDRRGNRTYRVRRGDLVGNARVLDITPRQVLFAVENFGVVRQERLELKRQPGGAQG